MRDGVGRRTRDAHAIQSSVVTRREAMDSDIGIPKVKPCITESQSLEPP